MKNKMQTPIMNTLTVFEMDRMLELIPIAQLKEYKEKLCKECQDLAQQFIESTTDFGQESVKLRYEYKKEVVRRICVQENLRRQDAKNVFFPEPAKLDSL